jgi:antitoxin (DNA-binding transcriptional repressor) of toxin-antitoxin stability system
MQLPAIAGGSDNNCRCSGENLPLSIRMNLYGWSLPVFGQLVRPNPTSGARRVYLLVVEHGVVECIELRGRLIRAAGKNCKQVIAMTITVDEAQAKLKQLVQHLTPGEEVILIENEQPVAMLVGAPLKSARQRPGPGLCKGMITYVAPDFDAPLEDMKEYMG